MFRSIAKDTATDTGGLMLAGFSNSTTLYAASQDPSCSNVVCIDGRAVISHETAMISSPVSLWAAPLCPDMQHFVWKPLRNSVIKAYFAADMFNNGASQWEHHSIKISPPFFWRTKPEWFAGQSPILLVVEVLRDISTQQWGLSNSALVFSNDFQPLQLSSHIQVPLTKRWLNLSRLSQDNKFKRPNFLLAHGISKNPSFVEDEETWLTPPSSEVLYRV